MAPVADKYLTVHSVCVKCLHETNVQTSWSSESGNIDLLYYSLTKQVDGWQFDGVYFLHNVEVESESAAQ